MATKPKVANFPGVMLAHSWTPKIDPTGWLMSEKLDGVRAIWNGDMLVTRSAIQIHAPKWFTDPFPRGRNLDGELWMGRGKFQKCSGAVRREYDHDDWKQITYQVFDTFGGMTPKPFSVRIDEAKSLIAKIPHAHFVMQLRIKSIDDMQEALASILREGGEGLIIRDPNSTWMPTRSHAMLKVKPFDECDAIVRGYEGGEGKHKGRVGSLICRLISTDLEGLEEITFNVGTGLSDADRDNPPPFNSKIRVGHCGFTDSGIPRFPSFLGIRAD